MVTFKGKGVDANIAIDASLAPTKHPQNTHKTSKKHLAHHRIRNARLIHRTRHRYRYDWLIDGVMSQADGNHGLSVLDAPFYITTRQDVTIRHVTIASNIGAKGATTVPIPLMYVGLGAAADATGEWYRGHVKMQTLTLFGTTADAIVVDGAGFLDIDNLHAGSTGYQSFYGGPGMIGGRCVNVRGPDASVVVTGGFCNSNLTRSGAGRALAFSNCTKISDVRSFNPVGRLPTPFSHGAPGAPLTIGPWGVDPRPQPGACYMAHGVDVSVLAMGDPAAPGHANYNLTVRDADGATMFTLASITSPMLLQVGWSLCFGALQLPGTISVGGA